MEEEFNDSDEFDEDDEAEEDSELSPVLFPFRRDERVIVDELIKVVREILGRGNVTGREVHDISKALFALERLPRPTPGVSIGLGVIYEYNRESTYCDFYISEDEFRLSSGGYAYDEHVGGDSYSSTLFEMEMSGFRDGSDDWFELSGWFDSIKGLLGGEHRISIEDMGDESKVDWSDYDESENYWEHLEE